MVSIRELGETGIIVIEPGDQLSFQAAEEVLKAVQAIPSAVGPSVIINMGKTRTIDRPGVSGLMKVMKHTKQAGGNFALAALQPTVYRMLTSMSLDRVIDIFETESLAQKNMISRPK